MVAAPGLPQYAAAGFKPRTVERPPASKAALAHLSIPMTFEPNTGQPDEGVQFVGRGKGITVFLTGDAIAMRVPLAARAKRESGDGLVMLRLKGARSIRWKGSGRLAGESNYFLGNDPDQWRTRVPHFERAEAHHVAPGVGLAVYGSEDGVEYDLRVAPGADVAKLRLSVSGASAMRVSADGDLLMSVAGTELRMKKPKVYQKPRSGWHGSSSKHRHSLGARRAKKYSPRTSRSRTAHPKISGKKRSKSADPCTARTPRDVPCPKKPGTPANAPAGARTREVDGSYVLEADGSIGFRIGPHDPGAALVIDPSLSVSYATFLGGSGTDTASSIAVDSAGMIYVGGTTGSTAFPGATTKRFGPADGPTQFFVAKIDPTKMGAASLAYLAFLGGGGFQKGGIIAVDALGDVAITGTTTASDYPVTDTSTPTSGLSSGLGNDVALSEINPAGNALVFSTLFGGSGMESQSGPGGIAVGPNGAVYIATDVETTQIDSASPDLPVTSGAYLTAWDGQAGDAFLAEFAPPAAAGGAATLAYCTYIGTNSVTPPRIGGVAVDISGNAYIAGSTSIALTPFPTKNAVQATYGGGPSDAFLMEIAPNLAPGGNGASDLVYSTLLGGSSADQALAVALDSANPPNAYVTGTTQSMDFPVNGAVGAYQPGLQHSASANAFLSVVSQQAITGATTLAYSTYFGGQESDAGNGVAAVSRQAVYVTGTTSSWGLPWRDNLQPFNGTVDAFVAKFDTTMPGAPGLIYATPLGGTASASGTAGASGNSIAADGAGHVYVAGATTSGDFPTAVTTQEALGGFQSQCASCGLNPAVSDAFAAEIGESPALMPSVYFNVGRVNFNAVGSGGGSQPVVVVNGGEANLHILDVAVSGPNASDFSLSNTSSCLAQPIAPGPAVLCSFDVVFAPTSSGPESAVVLVTDDAPGSPQELEITGNGTAALVTASPGTLSFGNQPENVQSQPQEITVANLGGQPVTISAIVPGGADTGEFILAPGGGQNSPPCSLSAAVPPAGQCVLKVIFDPNALRTFNAQIQFGETAGQNTSLQQTVTLTGVGVPAAPIAGLTQSSLTFGSQSVGAASGSQTVTMTNVGSAPLNISQVALSGPNASDFAMVPPASGTPCPSGGTTLALQASCNVAVQFAPQTAGAKSAMLVFTDNAAPGSQQVALSGTAVAAASLQVSPPSLAFGAQSESTTSAPLSITIANSGGSAVQVGGITIGGPNAGDFSAPSACTPNPVAPGKSCQISVTFAPAATNPGIRSASLSVPTAAPASVALSGTATQAAISVPTSMNFGSQLAGGPGGSPQPVVVTNSSSGPYAGTLTVNSVTKTGANAGDFVISSDACTGGNTAPGSTCTFQVAFKPLAAQTCSANGGTRSASLSLTDNAPGSPHTIPLSGTATSFCVGTSPGQAVQGPVTAGTAATYSLEVDSYSGFTGSAALACGVQPTASSPPEPNYISGCAITTTPATNPPVVQVAPNTPGQFQLVVNTTTAPIGAAVRARAGPAAAPRGQDVLPFALSAMLLLGAALGIRGRATATRLAQAAAFVFLCALLFAACGGGGSTAVDPPPPSGNFTYTVTVTATLSGAGQPNVQTQFSFPLTVNQPN